MKPSLILVAIISCSVAWNVVVAETTTPGCEAAKEKVWKVKQFVHKRQRAVHQAQRETRLAYSQLVECRPGAVFSAGRAQRCAHAQSDVPLQVQVQLDAEDRLQVALADYQERLEWVTQECKLDEPMVTQQDLLVRIASLEDEIKALMALAEQLKDQ